MDPRLHGVPLSVAPKVAPSYNKPSGIRAPLTVDESDFEYYASSKSHRNSTTSSYSELESEDCESVEDEFENASDRPHDDEILQETHFVKEYAFSEPFVNSPNGVIAQENGSVSGNALLRPLVRIPDERISNVDDSDDSRSFLSDSGDELAENQKYALNYDDSRPIVARLDGEGAEIRPIPVVDVEVPVVQKLHIPIARISGDSDDDSQSSEVFEDVGFSGIVRIPSIEVLHRVNSALRVRMLESDEEDENESRDDGIVEMESDEDLVVSNVILGTSDEEEHSGVEIISAGMIQDECPDTNIEGTDKSLAANEEINSISESGEIGDLMHLDEGIRESDDQNKCVELHLDEGIRESDDQNKCVELVEDEGIVFPESISDGASISEPSHLCDKIKPTEDAARELRSSSNFSAASLDDEDIRRSNIWLEDNLVFDHDHESEIVEIDQTVYSSSSNAAHNVSSVHQCVDAKESPFPGLTEAVVESMQICTSDSHSKDASLTGVVNSDLSVSQGSNLELETRKETVNSDWLTREVEHSTFHADTKVVVAVMDRATSSDGEILQDHLQEIDGQIVADSDVVDTDGGVGGFTQIIDPAPPAVFPEAVKGPMSDDSVVEIPPVDDFVVKSNFSDLSSPCSASPRVSDNFVPPSTNGKLEEALSETEKKKIEKVQQIRVKYLRLLHRLGISPEDSVASKVFYQLKLADENSYYQAFHLDSTTKAAMELEAQKKDDMNSSLRILVIGKTGVGKSATINSIFGERKAVINAFEPATTLVKEIVGTIDGLKLKVFDTPGFRTSILDQSINRKVLSSIKKLMQKFPPDVILYVDRLDTQTSNLNDLPLLKSVTSYLGSSIWRKTIIAFTHGTSIPPDGPDGCPISNEVFVARQSWAIQHLICHSSEELLMKNPCSTIPVRVIENHPFTPVHYGKMWRSELLLLCYSLKSLSEVRSLAMIQNPLDDKKLFGLQIHLPALSSFLESNFHPNISNDETGETVVSDVELWCSSDSNQEGGIEYDNIPPCKPLKRSQIAKLNEEEYDYHIKHLQKKQSTPFMKCKKSRSGAGDETYMTLPPSFDGDDPSFRHPFLEPSSQLLTRPLLNSHGLDHDYGYNGVLIEDKLDIGNHFPAVISVQLTKDKKEFDLHIRSSIANQTTLGMSITRYGDDLICGLQSQFSAGRNSELSINAGLNSKLSGQISIKTSCAAQLQIAALAFVLLRKVFDKRPRITQTGSVV